MSLEQDIKQEKFTSPYHKLGVNLIHKSHWINYQLQKSFKELEITHQQYNVLRILRGQLPNSISVKEIKERMLDQMSDVTRLIDKLIEKGLVERNISTKDRRSIKVNITNKGIKLLKSLDYIDEQMEILFSNLSIEEVNSLNMLLDKITSK
ncbi:MAG: MarR family winged helix-turn-helix transcriptional regulator [Bacteroidia bacterium]